MDPREEISEDVLASTKLVLDEYAPWLRAHLVQIIVAGPSQPADSSGGKFMRDRYRLNLPLAAVEDIVACLQQVEQARGAETRFALNSISRLLMVWNYQADRLRRAK